MTPRDDENRPRPEWSAAKQALFARLRKSPAKGGAAAAQRASEASGGSIPRRAGDDAVPASPSQERFWLAAELAGETRLYHVAIAVKLAGVVHAAHLETAFRAVIARHASLRTGFALDARGALQQVIAPQVDWHLAQIDLRERAAAAQPIDVEQAIAAAGSQSFDLARPPLLRVTLIRTAPGEAWLSIVLHHLVCDGWSIMLLQREAAAVYNGLVRGEPVNLAAAELDFADVVLWRRSADAEATTIRDRDFWQQTLQGVLPELDWPLESPYPLTPTYAAGRRQRRLARSLTQQVYDFARQRQATPFMVLLAAWQATLARITGQHDFCIGLPIAGRTRPELEGMVGPLVNTLPLRATVDDELTAQAWLDHVRRQLLAASEHPSLPWEAMVASVAKVRTARRLPLAQSLFVMQNAPFALAAWEGLTPLELSLDRTEFSPYELTLDLIERDGEIDLTAIYQTELFSAAVIDRWLSAYGTLLAAFVAEPACPLKLLPVLTPGEIPRQSLRTGPARPLPETTLDVLIDERARQSPAALALLRDEIAWDYQRLADTAAQLAAALAAHGVAPGDRVAVALERTPELVATLLAIWKTGAAYVPLEVDHPLERQRKILKKLRPRMLIVDDSAPFAASHERLGATCTERGEVFERWQLPLDLKAAPAVAGSPADESPAECVSFDVCHWNALFAAAAQLEPLAASRASPDGVAYLLCTSGTTGEPKGVSVLHRGLVNHALAMVERLGLAPADHVAECLSIAFDAAAEGIFPALLAGAALRFVPRPQELSPDEWFALLRSQSIHVIQWPVPLWNVLVDHWPACEESPLALRMILVGGDVVSTTRLREWQARTGGQIGFRFAYGITESTITSTVWGLDGDASAIPKSPRIPIGHPIANTTIALVDRHGGPVLSGSRGEIYIGGVGVAAEYVGDAERTRFHFVADPFDPDSPLRYYRTGDSGRFREDGTLEFLGRDDDQFKIRGHRLEAGEVESLLAEHPAIRAAAAVLHPVATGDPQLVAFVVERAGTEATATELAEFLAERLPRPVVPSYFIRLDALPMSPNGKLDRDALRSHPLPAPTSAESLTAAAATIEAEVLSNRESLVAGQWQRVLGAAQPRLDDSFFDLGGDSIRAMQIVAGLHAAGWKSSLRTFFAAPTIRALAASLEPLAPQMAARVPVNEPLPMLPIAHWFCTSANAGLAHFNQAIAIDLAEHIDAAALRTAWEAVVRTHPSFALRYRQCEDAWEAYFTGDFAATPWEVVPCADRTTYDAAVAELQTSFALKTGPLAAALYVPTTDSRPARLVLAAHHLAIDAVSWPIVIADLADAYRQAASGDSITLAPPTLPPWEYAAALGAWIDRPLVQDRVAAWLAALPRPRDHKSSIAARPFAEADAAVIEHLLPAALCDRCCTALAAPFRLRPHEVVWAIVALAMAEALEERDVWVDLELHGREPFAAGIELDRSVGWFTALAPCGARLGDTNALAENLLALKDAFRTTHAIAAAASTCRWYRPETPLGRALAALPPRRVAYNDLGDASALRSELGAIMTSDVGPLRSPCFQRPAPLEVLTWRSAAGRHVRLTFDPTTYAPGAMQEIGAACEQVVERLLALAARTTASVASRSDFPLAALSPQDWATISAEPAAPAFEDLYPLAPLQRLMLVAHMQGQGGQLVGQLQGELVGKLDAAAWRAAWEWVALRHPALRTGFIWEGLSRPLQAVYARLPIVWSFEDTSHLSATEQAAAWRGRLQHDAEAPFDLTRPPLWRVTLITLSSDRHAFAWSCHHAITDGWCLPIVLGEVCSAYAEFRAGRTPSLSPARPFRDYIRHLGELDPAPAAEYWKEYLTGVRIAAPLPLLSPPGTADRARSNTATRMPMSIEATLAARTAAALRALARARGVTLATLIQAACGWSTLWHAGEHEHVHGTTVAGRPAALAGSAAMVGVLMNVLPTRLARTPGVAAIDLARRLQADRLAADEHAHLTLPEIAAAAGQTVLRPLDVGFVCENYPRGEASIRALPEAELELAHLEGTIAATQLLVWMTWPGDAILLRLQYDGDRLAAPHAEELFATALDLLAELPTSIDRPLEAWSTWQSRTPLVDDLPMRRMPAVAVEEEAVEEDAGDATAVSEGVLGSDETTATITYADALEADLAAIWQATLEVDSVRREDTFLALGGTSLAAVALVEQVEQRFGQRLPLAMLFAQPTLAQMAAWLRGETDSSEEQLVLPLQTSGAGTPLFLIHPAGGTVFCYRAFAAALPAEQPVYGVQARGLDGLQPPQTTIEAMAETYIEAIRRVQPQGPYRLGGWSSGGIYAYEVARQFERQGEAVELLLLFDAGLPAAGRGFTADDLAPLLAILFPAEDASAVAALRDRPLDEQRAYFAARAAQAQIALPEMDSTLAARLFAVFRTHLEAIVAYQPRPFAGPLLIVRAERTQLPWHADRYLHWGDWATGPLAVEAIDAEHIDLFASPAVEAVAARVAAYLNRLA